MKKKLFLCLIPAFQLVFAQLATEPKIYQNYPRGMQLVQAGYVLQSTNSTVDGNIPLPNSDIDVNANIGFLRYAHFFNIGGKTAGIQLMLPYVGIDANILGVEANSSGLGDMLFVFGTNIIGGNSMSFPEFLQAKKKTTLAWSLGITAPTGSYSKDKLLNPGGNRWQFRPELALTVPVHKWDFEAYLNTKFFTENNEQPSLLPGAESSVLKQKPLYGLTLHAVYNFNSQLWASLDAAGRVGGKTSVDGAENDDSQSQMGIGATINYSPSIHHQIGLNFLTNAANNDYAPKGTIFSLKYMYVFGAGIDKTLEAIKMQQSQN